MVPVAPTPVAVAPAPYVPHVQLQPMPLTAGPGVQQQLDALAADNLTLRLRLDALGSRVQWLENNASGKQPRANKKQARRPAAAAAAGTAVSVTI